MIRLNLKAIKAKVVLAVCALMLFAYGASAEGIALKSQTLRYAIKYKKYDAGELEIIIQRNQQQIKITAISHLNFLAKVLTPGFTVENRFAIEHETAYLKSGHSRSHNNKTIKRSFDIDRKQGRIKQQPGERVMPINKEHIFEASAFPIILITSDIASIQGQIVQVVSYKRISEYIYLAPEQHTLMLNGRRFETWKVTRQKLGDATRTVTLWLDKNNQQLPVKIISTKKNKATVMTLLPAA